MTEERLEYDRTMTALDEYITDSVADRRITKALEAGDADYDDADDVFPSTVEGLAAFAQSGQMRDLLRDDPDEFRRRYLDFVLNHQLVAKGLVTPAQVGIWAQKLAQLQPVHANVRSTPTSLIKATVFAENVPRPWEFSTDARGLAGFLHSSEMLQLQHERPAYWRRLHLDFFSSMVPPPTPQEISIKRQQLELTCPDDPRASVVAKSLPGGHLSYGQSVLVSNFGPSVGDPSIWMKS